ncbi:MAG TPA: hypothetical protein VIH49_08520 [Solirubrobacteraceae bacterium]
MAVGLVAIAVILVVVLSQKAQRRSGANLTPGDTIAATVLGERQACQDDELLPADTAAVQATITAFGQPLPALRIVFTSGPGGRVLSSGGLPAGRRAGLVRIPIRYVARSSQPVRVCLRNLGPASIGITGAYPDPPNQMLVGGAVAAGRLRYDYYRRGRESWMQLLPTIVHRWTLAKAGIVRHWAWVAIPLLMLFAIGLAALTLIREEPS